MQAHLCFVIQVCFPQMETDWDAEAHWLNTKQFCKCPFVEWLFIWSNYHTPRTPLHDVSFKWWKRADTFAFLVSLVSFCVTNFLFFLPLSLQLHWGHWTSVCSMTRRTMHCTAPSTKPRWANMVTLICSVYIQTPVADSISSVFLAIQGHLCPNSFSDTLVLLNVLT